MREMQTNELKKRKDDERWDELKKEEMRKD